MNEKTARYQSGLVDQKVYQIEDVKSEPVQISHIAPNQFDGNSGWQRSQVGYLAHLEDRSMRTVAQSSSVPNTIFLQTSKDTFSDGAQSAKGSQYIQAPLQLYFTENHPSQFAAQQPPAVSRLVHSNHEAPAVAFHDAQVNQGPYLVHRNDAVNQHCSYEVPIAYSVVEPKMHPNKTSTLQYIPQTVMYYPNTPQVMHSSNPGQQMPCRVVRSNSMGLTPQVNVKQESNPHQNIPVQGMSTSLNNGNNFSGSAKVEISPQFCEGTLNVQRQVAADSSQNVPKSDFIKDMLRDTGAQSQTFELPTSDERLSKSSLKSSPSRDEYSSDFEMDLSQLPAFNFNLEEICEDVLFPEQDEFDDLLVDDLTISPTPSLDTQTSIRSTPVDQSRIKNENQMFSCPTQKPEFFSPSTEFPDRIGDFASQQQSQESFNSSNMARNLQLSTNGGSTSALNEVTVKSEDRSVALSSPSSCALVPPQSHAQQPVREASGSVVTPSGNVRRRRRPDRPTNVKEACSICGDKASGYHYNALSCEGCKGFFRRSVTNDRKYTCEKNGACNIDIYMRRKCQKCRLERCYAAGMRKECLMSVEQCRSMQAKRKHKLVSNQSSNPSSSSPVAANTTTTPTPLLFTDAPPFHASLAAPPLFTPPSSHQQHPSHQMCPAVVQMDQAPEGAQAAGVVNLNLPPRYDCHAELLQCGLSPREIETVGKLVSDRWSVGMPSVDKIQLLPPWPGRTGDPSLTSLPADRQRQMKFQHMTHLTRICMEGVIQLAKRLLNFSELDQQDQIKLVKPACIEVLLINSAQYFDVSTDKLLMATGYWTTHEQLDEGLLKYGFGVQMWEFVRKLAMMQLHDIEFALLTAICVLSPDRPGLTPNGQKQVMQLREPYKRCLELFCERYSPPKAHVGSHPHRTRMSELLAKLLDLRCVSLQHRKYLFGIKLSKSNWEPLPQLLGEIFDQTNSDEESENSSPLASTTTVTVSSSKTVKEYASSPVES